MIYVVYKICNYADMLTLFQNKKIFCCCFGMYLACCLSFYTLVERKYDFMWISFSMKSQKTQHLLTLFRFA